MPFGITNTLATFQSLTIDIFWVALKLYVLVFFDDIMVYCKNWSEHACHINIIFQTLMEH